MTWGQRMKRVVTSLLVVSLVWLALMTWDYRGVPPREELEGTARGFAIGLALVVIVETVIHLVRRPSRR